MAAANAVRSFPGCQLQHCTSNTQTLTRRLQSPQPTSWVLPHVGKPFKNGVLRRPFFARAAIGSRGSGAGPVTLGNGGNEMWKSLQRDKVERSMEPMPKEVFVLADANDDDELEDETLEEMDDDEALFDHESTSDEVSDEVASESTDGQEEAASDISASEAAEGEVEENAEVVAAEDALDEEEEEEGEEVELSWAQEKFLDVKQSVGVVVDRVPGPRVASSNVPWLIAVPLSYLAITLLISIAKVIKRNNMPRAHRKRQVREVLINLDWIPGFGKLLMQR